MRDRQANMRHRVATDLRDHEMKVVQDNGLHRTLFFGRPGSGIYRFYLTTWPGHLAISGDAGDMITSRLRDMFEFHRQDPWENISYDYWAEKVQAVPKHGGCYSFSEDCYREAIRSDMASYLGDFPDWADKRTIVQEAHFDDLLTACPDNERDAMDRAMSWRCPITDKQPFCEFWDHRLTEPSFQFRWLCHAIVWGIRRYDLHRAGTTQADHDREVLAGRQ